MIRVALGLFVALVASTALSCSGAEKSKTSDEATDEVVEKKVEETAEETAESPEEEEAPADQGEGIPWKSKTDEQKKAYMKGTVKPQMAELFSEFDGEKFAEFKCTTCHGPSARDGNFEMPNPELPKLDDWEKLEAEKPKYMEFMKSKVEPQMAKLLDQKPFDPETKTGFGCSGCHPH